MTEKMNKEIILIKDLMFYLEYRNEAIDERSEPHQSRSRKVHLTKRINLTNNKIDSLILEGFNALSELQQGIILNREIRAKAMGVKE